MNDNLNNVLTFLNKLEEGKLYFTLCRSRPEAIMVKVEVPGEYWEVEFFPDGNVEVERFKSNGEIFGVEALQELFSKYAEH